ncbi:MAG: hypothetical protein Q8O42_23560 [Acidobacteriota bacterium]|nr:hypothetical protein [Acidobacteriota bacterium]
MALAATGTTAEAGEQSPLVVHVDDRMGVSAGDLAGARRAVEEIFANAGVSILWKEGRFPASVVETITKGVASRQVAVVLVNNTDDPLPGASGCTLGFAAKRPAVAYAYYNRVIEHSLLHPIDARVLLGRVIAHELGHVLLPPNSHSLHGIMRGNIDLGLEKPDRFTRDQALMIRAVLAGSVVSH